MLGIEAASSWRALMGKDFGLSRVRFHFGGLVGTSYLPRHFSVVVQLETSRTSLYKVVHTKKAPETPLFVAKYPHCFE